MTLWDQLCLSNRNFKGESSSRSWTGGCKNDSEVMWKDELSFYENLSNLLDKYKPVIYSWSKDFIYTKINDLPQIVMIKPVWNQFKYNCSIY